MVHTQEDREKIKKAFLETWEFGDPDFYQIIWKACELHELKNRGYAGKRNPLANFYECEDFGVKAWKGCLVRMSDKWSRMKTLVNEENDPVLIEAKKMESLEDTIFDLGVYAFIELILLRRAKAEKVYKEILEKDSSEDKPMCTCESKASQSP